MSFSIGLKIQSRDDDDVNGSVMLMINERYKFINCNWVKPVVKEVNTIFHGEPLNYKEYIQRAFGFSYGYNVLHIYRGITTCDSNTDTTIGWFLPWLEWNHIRTSLLNYDCSFFADFENSKKGIYCDYEVKNALKEKCNYLLVEFNDYDGTHVTAKLTVEENEWERGIDHFKWLKYIFKNLVLKSLCIDFDKGVGEGKKDWKGGILSCSINLKKHRDVYSRFLEYASKNNFTNVKVLSKITDREWYSWAMDVSVKVRNGLITEMTPKTNFITIEENNNE